MNSTSLRVELVTNLRVMPVKIAQETGLYTACVQAMDNPVAKTLPCGINPSHLLELAQNPAYSLKDLGRLLDVSYESVRQALIQLGVHPAWKSSRRAFLEWMLSYNRKLSLLKRLMQDLLAIPRIQLERLVEGLSAIPRPGLEHLVLDLLAVARTKGDGYEQEAMDKAIAYRYSRCPHTTIPLAKLFELFHTYIFGIAHGERPMLKQVGARLGLHFTTVSKVLIKMDAGKPYVGVKHYEKLTSYQMRQVAMACIVDTRLNNSDMGYLLGIPPNKFRDFRRRRSLKARQPPFLKNDCFGRKLMYSDAIRLYQALGDGCSLKEARLKVGLSHKDARWLLRNRREIEIEVERFMNYIRALDLYDALDLGYGKEEAMYLAGITSEVDYYYLIQARETLEARVEKVLANSQSI
ncbi:hypothetical protein DRJ48_04980 [Candidatus Woesearchaeota archaeon]|nr:MAG: hypothetical protein DRJ48_04980 [Candidatus Woesearchaeota archaeon]